MSARTPEQAKELLCPLARCFAGTVDSPAVKGCRGAECAVWRWTPLPAELLSPHIAARMTEQGNKDHRSATAWVMKNRQELGIPLKPTHGFCGLGGVI